MLGILLIGFFLMAAINIPIAFCMGIGVLFAMNFTTPLPLTVISLKMYSIVASFPLIAIPLYVIAGSLMNKSGITNRLINLAKTLIGFMRGGLSMSTVLACMFFGGVSGSSLADSAAIGSVLIPELNKEGYDPHFSAALVASAGTLGSIIPPSIAMVLYGVVTQTSIAQLFLAGFIPGVLLGVSFMIGCYVFAVINKYPVGPRPTIKSAAIALFEGLVPLGMPIIIVGGIYGGVFTATEAGMIAILYAMIVGVFVFRSLTVKDLIDTIFESALVASVPVLIISFSGGFAHLNSYTEVPKMISQMIYSVTSNKFLILFFLNIMLLVIGMFMDGAAVYPIVAPIFLPVLMQLGVSPIQFGAIMVVNLSIGMITPPVGGCLYTACAVAGLKPMAVARKSIIFLAVAIGVLFLVTYVPWISEYIPSLLSN